MGEQMLRIVLVIFTIIGSFCVFATDTELKLYRPFVDGTQVVINKKIQENVGSNHSESKEKMPGDV